MVRNEKGIAVLIFGVGALRPIALWACLSLSLSHDVPTRSTLTSIFYCLAVSLATNAESVHWSFPGTRMPPHSHSGLRAELYSSPQFGGPFQGIFFDLSGGRFLLSQPCTVPS